MDIILSTRNRSKIEQIKAIFTGLDLNVLSLEDAGISGEGVEDGKTLEENAFKKALFANQRSGKWSIADDTGLYIDALQGQPGIHAARWAGDVSTDDIMWFTLEKLDGVPYNRRGATFKTVAVVSTPEGGGVCFTGSVRGVILTAPRTKCQPNMPYSAIFLPEGSALTFAEMTVQDENAISQRGSAFRQVREYFAQQQSFAR